MFFLLLRRITDARICVSLCALCCAVPLCHLPRSVQKTSRWPDNSMSFVYTFPTRTLSLSSLHNQKANDSIHIVWRRNGWPKIFRYWLTLMAEWFITLHWPAQRRFWWGSRICWQRGYGTCCGRGQVWERTRDTLCSIIVHHPTIATTFTIGQTHSTVLLFIIIIITTTRDRALWQWLSHSRGGWIKLPHHRQHTHTHTMRRRMRIHDASTSNDTSFTADSATYYKWLLLPSSFFIYYEYFFLVLL